MSHLRFSTSAAEGGHFPAESISASSSQNQSPTTEFWEVSPPAGKSSILYSIFAISRLCAWGSTFQFRLGPAHRTRSTRDSISGAFSPWGEGFYLGHSSACAAVLGQGGASSCKVCYKLDGLSWTFSSARHCFERGWGISSLRYCCEIRAVCLGQWPGAYALQLNPFQHCHARSLQESISEAFGP